jgi:hypothetical protein
LIIASCHVELLYPCEHYWNGRQFQKQFYICTYKYCSKKKRKRHVPAMMYSGRRCIRFVLTLEGAYDASMEATYSLFEEQRHQNSTPCYAWRTRTHDPWVYSIKCSVVGSVMVKKLKKYYFNIFLNKN